MSQPVVAGLAVGIGFILLFAVLKIPEETAAIPTVPKFTEPQAAQIVIEDIQKYTPNTTRNDIYVFSGGKGYVALDRFLEEGKHLPLFYYHPFTGTRFFINGTDNSIISVCPKEMCHSKPELIGRLVYVFDMDCGEGCGVGAYYIDAIKGEVAYTNLPSKPLQQPYKPII